MNPQEHCKLSLVLAVIIEVDDVVDTWDEIMMTMMMMSNWPGRPGISV